MLECEINIIRRITAFPWVVQPAEAVLPTCWEVEGSPKERCCVKENSCPFPDPFCATIFLFLLCLQNLCLKNKIEKKKEGGGLRKEVWSKRLAVNTNPSLHFKLLANPICHQKD